MGAADSAQYDSPPSELLQLALNCQSWACLPNEGGYLDQPAGLMRKLRTLLNVYNSFSSMINTSLNQQAWSERNMSMWKVVSSVERMRRG